MVMYFAKKMRTVRSEESIRFLPTNTCDSTPLRIYINKACRSAGSNETVQRSARYFKCGSASSIRTAGVESS
jgi:hypothetical protein